MNDMSPPPGQVPDLVAPPPGNRTAIVKFLDPPTAAACGGWWRCTSTPAPGASRRLGRHPGRLHRGHDAVDGYIRDPAVPFYIWLRFLVGQRVQEQHRRHLGTSGRDVGRKCRSTGAHAWRSTGALAARLLGNLTSPSQAAVRTERKI